MTRQVLHITVLWLTEEQSSVFCEQKLGEAPSLQTDTGGCLLQHIGSNMVYGKVLSCVVGWKDVRLSDCGIVLISKLKLFLRL